MNRFRRVCASRMGFSLIELLTGLGVVAVVSSVTVPTASVYLARYRLTSSANQVGFEITRTRMQAIGQNVWARLRLADSTHYVRERSTDNGTTWVQDGATISLPSGVVGWVAGTPTFNRSGIANTTTYVVLYNSRGYKVLTINVLGRVSISTILGSLG